MQKEAGNENKEGRGTFGGIMRSSYDLLKRDWKAHMLKDIERLEKPLARGDDLVFKKQRVVYLNRQPSARGQVMISVQGVAHDRDSSAHRDTPPRGADDTQSAECDAFKRTRSRERVALSASQAARPVRAQRSTGSRRGPAGPEIC